MVLAQRLFHHQRAAVAGRVHPPQGGAADG
jgi:hypothetical protein